MMGCCRGFKTNQFFILLFKKINIKVQHPVLRRCALAEDFSGIGGGEP
jgi:hypothetical protein